MFGDRSASTMQYWQGKCSPIALFVYNRPEHTRRTVESLRRNWLSPLSDLIVFSESPKTAEGAAAVIAVRELVRKISGFKSLTVVEREQNLGLAKSVISGISQVCGQFGRVIALEDDLLTTPDFLTFMNSALNRYSVEPRIFSVSGFNFALRAPGHHPFDAFCFYRSSSWGWGTWKDRWDKCDWEVGDYDRFLADPLGQRSFNRGGEDLTRMLHLQMARRIDSWAIRWAYAHYRSDALALLSVQPRVFHIGSDSSATHSKRRGSFKQLPLTSELKSSFMLPTGEDLQPKFVAELQNLLRPSPARKVVRFVRDILWERGLSY
jgi:hypothetical protein